MAHSLSYGDAAIVTAAEANGFSLLLSEDLNDGGRCGSIEVRNLFRRLE